MGGLGGVVHKASEIWPVQICSTQCPPQVRWPGLAQADKLFFAAAPVAIGAKAITRIPVDELQYAAASGWILQCVQKSLSRSWKISVAILMLLQKNGALAQ